MSVDLIDQWDKAEEERIAELFNEVLRPGTPMGNEAARLAAEAGEQVEKYAAAQPAASQVAMAGGEVRVVTTPFRIKSYSFSFWGAFYARLYAEIVYETGEVRYFEGEGGGIALGGGKWWGANDFTSFNVGPDQIIGECGFSCTPGATIGALVSFWNGGHKGTLVGAGVGTIAVFGGRGHWRK